MPKSRTPNDQRSDTKNPNNPSDRPHHSNDSRYYAFNMNVGGGNSAVYATIDTATGATHQLKTWFRGQPKIFPATEQLIEYQGATDHGRFTTHRYSDHQVKDRLLFDCHFGRWYSWKPLENKQRPSWECPAEVELGKWELITN